MCKIQTGYTDDLGGGESEQGLKKKKIEILKLASL